MTTAFEFLPPKRRQIGFGPIAVVPFFVSAFILTVSVWLLKEDTQRVQDEFTREKSAIEARKTEVISKIRGQTPDPKILSELDAKIKNHNFSLIGRNFPWSKLFETLERVLPDDSVIARIENAQTGNTVFIGDDCKIKILVIVSDPNSNKSFYQKLSAEACFTSLSFTPLEERMYQRKKGVAVELIFTFEDKI